MYEIKNFMGSLKNFKSKTEKIIVLDVEGYSTCRPYNVGYIVADLHGTIYKRRSFALPECIWENIVSMVASRSAEEMTKANVKEILQQYGIPKIKRKYHLIGINHFTEVFTADVEKFNIKRLFAYNVNFDKGSIRRLIGDKTFYKLNLEYCDIISGITATRLQTVKYLNYCIENGYITEKGNFMTKAEIVYRYLKDLPEFTEEHTGLADVLIEYDILLTAIHSHKKINWKPCQAWRILKSFAETKGIKVN